MITPARAVVSHDAETVTLIRDCWSEVISTDDLDKRLTLYRDLAERKHPRFGSTPYRQIYAPMIKAIERAIKISNTMKGI